MTWVTAIASVAAAQQASAAGRYNQAVQERNAKVKEQEAEQAEKQLDFDLARFDQQFVKLQGETKTVAQSQKMEEANFARMSGQIARNEARAAQIGYYAKAGESLLKAYG